MTLVKTAGLSTVAIAPLVSVTESAATASPAINAECVVTAALSAKVIAVTPPSFTFATFTASQFNTVVFDTEPETVTESAAKEAILVSASSFTAVNIFRISVSVNSAFAIDPAAIPNPARSVFASTLSLALGCTSKVPVPVNPPASWIALKSAISTTKVEFRVTPPTLLSEMPVAITLPSDTTSVPPARSITLPAVKVMVSSLSFDMSNVSVPPSRSTLISVETVVTVPAPASVAFISTFPAPDAFSFAPFIWAPVTVTTWPAATANSFGAAAKTSSAVPVRPPRVNVVVATPPTVVVEDVMSPVAVPPNEITFAASVTVKVTGALLPPPPQAASGRSRNGKKPCLFFLAAFIHFLRKASLASPAGIYTFSNFAPVTSANLTASPSSA